MLKKTIFYTSFVVAAGMIIVGSTFAASNPSGTGQPSADCANESSAPSGFGTTGFANAESHYAGSTDTPSANNAQSSSAVSQYDVACYQVSQSH